MSRPGWPAYLSIPSPAGDIPAIWRTPASGVAAQSCAALFVPPFAEEMNLTMREISLGKLRRDALKEMAERCQIPDLTTFITAVVQAESMGTSIATVLRVQAEQMRIKRRQRAEQMAQQAPVKMIFPLVLCIFPTLFIVILGPAAITVYETLIKDGGA